LKSQNANKVTYEEASFIIQKYPNTNY